MVIITATHFDRFSTASKLSDAKKEPLYWESNQVKTWTTGDRGGSRILCRGGADSRSVP